MNKWYAIIIELLQFPHNLNRWIFFRNDSDNSVSFTNEFWAIMEYNGGQSRYLGSLNIRFFYKQQKQTFFQTRRPKNTVKNMHRRSLFWRSYFPNHNPLIIIIANVIPTMIPSILIFNLFVDLHLPSIVLFLSILLNYSV